MQQNNRHITPPATTPRSAPASVALNKPAAFTPSRADIVTPTLGKQDSTFGKVKSVFKSRKMDIAEKQPILEDEEKRNSIRVLIIASLAFLLFYLILSFQSLRIDENDRSIQTQSALNSQVETGSQTVGKRIRDIMIWVDNGLTLYQSPQQSLGFIQQHPDVRSVVITRLNGGLIGATENAEQLVKQIPTDLKDGQFVITSQYSEDGTPYPVIVRQQNAIRIAIALNNKSLIDSMVNHTAIFSLNGRLIDGDKTFSQKAPHDIYGLTRTQFDALIGGRFEDGIKTNKDNSKKWAVSKTIPVWNIAIAATSPQPKPSLWLGKSLVFTILFLGTCGMLWMFVKNIRKHNKLSHRKHQGEEILNQRFKAAAESGRGGIWEVDVENNTAFVSASLAEILGIKRQNTDMLLSQFLSLIHENHRSAFFQNCRRAHINGQFTMEISVAARATTVECSGMPLVRGADLKRVIVGMARDVSEVYGAKTRLEATKKRLNNALSSMNDSFVVWDAMNRIVVWNNRFEVLFGFKEGQLEQGLDHAIVLYHAQNSVEATFPSNIDDSYQVKLKNGTWLHYQESITPDGSRVGVGTDITDIRSRENDLQQNHEALQKTVNVLKESQLRMVELAESYQKEKIRAEEANQSKSDFLANMSHELRTPLNAINGFSDIMKKEMFGPLGDPRYKEYVGDILFSGQHLLSLINDILDMSKIEAGKMSLNPEDINIVDMVEQVIRIVRGRAEENNLSLIYEANEVPDIQADMRAVKQVLLNLITNAIKFTPEGGAVTIKCEAKSVGLIIKIIDTGIGIAADDLERLANPFEQIDSQHSRQHEGTGLGLALSKSFIELHGGNFKIESQLGVGTTVIFTLPNTPITPKVAVNQQSVTTEINELAQNIADVLKIQEIADEQSSKTTLASSTFGAGITGLPNLASPQATPHIAHGTPPMPVTSHPQAQYDPAPSPYHQQSVSAAGTLDVPPHPNVQTPEIQDSEDQGNEKSGPVRFQPPAA